MSHRRQRGISLVEILVALAVSAILLAGVVQLFLSTKQTYNTMEGLARLQEDGRFGLEFLAQDLRSAGYYGCNGRELAIFNAMNDGGTQAENFFRFRINQPLRGFEATPGAATWTPDPVAAGALQSAPALVGDGFSSDVLAVRRPLGEPLALATPIGAGAMTLDVAGLECPGWLPDDEQTVVIADCEGAHARQVRGAPTLDKACPNTTTWQLPINVGGSDPGNLETVNRTYNMNRTEVMRFVTRVYFVDDLDDDGVPSLYRLEDPDTPMVDAVELVPGVDSMQIRYGVDIDPGDRIGSANAYLDANVVEADNLWNNVVSINVALLVRTLEPVLDGPQTQQHCLLGDPLSACAGGAPADATNSDNWTDANDAFLRKVYASTVVLRNRALTPP